MERKKQTNYLEVMSRLGREGKHITEVWIELGISQEEHIQLLEGNQKYKKGFDEYNKLCENYWFEMARSSMQEDYGKKFNTRLWSLIMRNKFGQNWTDQTKVDLTSDGKVLNNPDPIKIEIIRNNLPQ